MASSTRAVKVPTILSCGPRHNIPRPYSLGAVTRHYLMALAAPYRH